MSHDPDVYRTQTAMLEEALVSLGKQARAVAHQLPRYEALIDPHIRHYAVRQVLLLLDELLPAVLGPIPEVPLESHWVRPGQPEPMQTLRLEQLTL